MKQIILSVVLLSLLSLGLYAQENKGVKFEEGTLEQALNKAKKNKKGANLVFLDCYTTWCGPCKQMANIIFPMEAAGTYFNANFINIKIDMEKGEGPELAKKYKITGYPTFIILSSDGKEIGRVIGSNELEPFIESVEKAKDIKSSVAYLENKFNNSKTSDNAVAYIEALGRNSMNKEITAFMNENFSVFNDWAIFTDKMWKYLSLSISYDNKAVLEYLVDNKMRFNLTFGTDRVNNALRNCYKIALIEYLRGKRSLTKDEVIVLANNMNFVLDSDNREEDMYAKLAKWEVTENYKAIAAIFNFRNLIDMTPFGILQFEEIFAKYDCITKKMFEQYYKSKNKYTEVVNKDMNRIQEKVIKAKIN